VYISGRAAPIYGSSELQVSQQYAAGAEDAVESVLSVGRYYHEAIVPGEQCICYKVVGFVVRLCLCYDWFLYLFEYFRWGSSLHLSHYIQ
jgi:hypothetical protein